MFRFLKEAVRDYGARLSSVDGGSLRNAIPREAFAVITIPGDNVEALWELVSDYQEMYRYEYKGPHMEQASSSALFFLSR